MIADMVIKKKATNKNFSLIILFILMTNYDEDDDGDDKADLRWGGCSQLHFTSLVCFNLSLLTWTHPIFAIFLEYSLDSIFVAFLVLGG